MALAAGIEPAIYRLTICRVHQVRLTRITLQPIISCLSQQHATTNDISIRWKREYTIPNHIQNYTSKSKQSIGSFYLVPFNHFGTRIGLQCCPSTMKRAQAAVRRAYVHGWAPAPCFFRRDKSKARTAILQPWTYRFILWRLDMGSNHTLRLFRPTLYQPSSPGILFSKPTWKRSARGNRPITLPFGFGRLGFCVGLGGIQDHLEMPHRDCCIDPL